MAVPRPICLLLGALACASSQGSVAGVTSREGESDRTAAQISEEEGRALLTTDIGVSPYRLEVPPEFRSGTLYSGLFTICVSSKGEPFGVHLDRKTSNPQVDVAWVQQMLLWRYRPYLVDGRPTHFCHPMTVVLR